MASKVVGGDDLSVVKNDTNRGGEFIAMESMGRGTFLEMMVRREGITKSATTKSMGRGKVLEMMTPNECIAHQQKRNQTIPHCRKCCQYELWVPPDNQLTTYSGDVFID